MDYPFKIRYVIINSNLIFNECGPESVGPWLWTEDQIQTRRNAALRIVEKRNERDKFYSKLEESILKEGIRNPIMVSAGWCSERKIKKLPPHMKEDKNKILICDRHGGSRLYIAQKYNMEIPCIVSDYCGMFSDGVELKNRNDILKYYRDKPIRIAVNANGIHIKGLPQVHLE